MFLCEHLVQQQRKSIAEWLRHCHNSDGHGAIAQLEKAEAQEQDPSSMILLFVCGNGIFVVGRR